MSRWLLLLGSNLADDQRVRAALDALGELGRCETLGPIRRLPPSGGGDAWYYNVVATLDHPGGAPLHAALHDLQARLGRDPASLDRIDIDIDLVARCSDDGHWIMDAHAASKPDMHDGPIAGLFDAVGVVLHPPAESE